MERFYLHDGVKHPVIEADYDTAFKVFKADSRKATIGDPTKCVEALGLRRVPNVAFAYVGSGGDAYVGYKDTKSSTGITVRHFTIPAEAGKVRDTFEQNKAIKSQILMLKAPSNGRTLSHRATLGKRRRTEIKAGASVKSRGPQKNKRIHRLGVSPRPRAKIIKGEISIQ